MIDSNTLFLIFVGSLVGAASGYLGSFMVLKRMSLVGDALSHVALPGIAIALTIGINPMVGALVALFVSTVGVWYLSERSDVYPESLVGIFFTASLALGVLLTPEPELLEALFGNIDTITKIDGLIIVLGAVLIFMVTKMISKGIMLGIVSDDLAKSQNIKMSKVNLTYLLMVGLVVALGVKFLGTLLTGALVIIPAVIAKNVSKSLKYYHIISIALGIFCSAFGIVVAKYFGLPTGPVVILSGVFIYLFSFIFKK